MADESNDSASLTEEDKQKIIQWVTDRLDKDTGLVCSVCQNKKWTVAADLVMPPVFKDDATQFGGGGYPLAMLICNKCAHTVFINAVRVGLIPNTDAQETDEPAATEENAAEKADG